MRIPTHYFRQSCAGLATLLALGGCVEPYAPDVVNAPNSYLVVDGFINGNGRTRLKLSRSQNVAATAALPPEKGATVFIVDDGGTRYALAELASGAYQSDSLLLNPARQYRLRLSLGGGSNPAIYESDLVPLKVTPPFDKLELVHQNDQFQLQFSTHDASGQSRYYRWNYAETWEFTSAYPSVLELRKGVIRTRVTPIYTCWHTERPSAITQRSTASLSQDVLVAQPIANPSDRSERFKIRYSVLVTQYAESAAEFAYNEILRKNTEAVGTVNDPLPSQLTGNVHRVDNLAEPVLGFVGAHTLVQRRLFLTPTTLGLPAGWVFENPDASCTIGVELVPDPTDKRPIYRPHTRLFASGDNVPTDYYLQADPTGTRGDTLGYIGAARECVDFHTRGTTTRPSFW